MGHGNYRHFFLFLFYMWVGCAYAVATTYLFAVKPARRAPHAIRHISVPHAAAIAAAGGSLSSIREASGAGDGVDDGRGPDGDALHGHGMDGSSSHEGGFLDSLAYADFRHVLSMTFAASAFVGISLLLFWHVVLVLTGNSTIDFFDNVHRWREARRSGEPWANPYHYGLAGNWKAVFDVSGPFWWFTWTLPPVKPKQGNGYAFPIAPAAARNVRHAAEGAGA